MTPPPLQPRIYHIVHVDKLPSILTDGCLFSDSLMAERRDAGTTVGMNHIKQRRLTKALTSHPDLTVGGCVPFYFCPRSVMLFLLHKGNHPDLAYRGGQTPMIHLEADMHEAVCWAQQAGKRWAFTTQNAGSAYFDDYSDLGHLEKIDWTAVSARDWVNNKEAKQAEFLVEECFDWTLFTRIGVYNNQIRHRVSQLLEGQQHQPLIEEKPQDWYY